MITKNLNPEAIQYVEDEYRNIDDLLSAKHINKAEASAKAAAWRKEVLERAIQMSENAGDTTDSVNDTNDTSNSSTADVNNVVNADTSSGDQPPVTDDTSAGNHGDSTPPIGNNAPKDDSQDNPNPDSDASNAVNSDSSGAEKTSEDIKKELDEILPKLAELYAKNRRIIVGTETDQKFADAKAEYSEKLNEWLKSRNAEFYDQHQDQFASAKDPDALKAIDTEANAEMLKNLIEQEMALENATIERLDQGSLFRRLTSKILSNHVLKGTLGVLAAVGTIVSAATLGEAIGSGALNASFDALGMAAGGALGAVTGLLASRQSSETSAVHGFASQDEMRAKISEISKVGDQDHDTANVANWLLDQYATANSVDRASNVKRTRLSAGIGILLGATTGAFSLNGNPANLWTKGTTYAGIGTAAGILGDSRNTVASYSQPEQATQSNQQSAQPEQVTQAPPSVTPEIIAKASQEALKEPRSIGEKVGIITAAIPELDPTLEEHSVHFDVLTGQIHNVAGLNAWLKQFGSPDDPLLQKIYKFAKDPSDPTPALRGYFESEDYQRALAKLGP